MRVVEPFHTYMYIYRTSKSELIRERYGFYKFKARKTKLSDASRGEFLTDVFQSVSHVQSSKRIRLTKPHDVRHPKLTTLDPKTQPVNRNRWFRVLMLDSLFSCAKPLLQSPQDPPEPPVFTYKSRRKVLHSRYSRESREKRHSQAEVLLNFHLTIFNQPSEFIPL